MIRFIDENLGSNICLIDLEWMDNMNKRIIEYYFDTLSNINEDQQSTISPSSVDSAWKDIFFLLKNN